MAKYATKRKRSYKKRRTIRKLKTTLRRKIQRGGDPLLIKLFFIIFIALFSNSPLGRAFITILKILSGTPIEDGDSEQPKYQNITQRGGGKLGDALNAFKALIEADSTIKPQEKSEIIECIDKLRRDNALDSVPTTVGNDVIVDNTSTPPETSVPNDLKKYFTGIIDKMNDLILTKVNFIRDDDKKKCMMTILNFGFKLMKTKLSSMEFKELVAANAKVLAQQGKDIAANAKGHLTNMWRNRSPIASSVANSMPQNLQQGKEMVNQVLNNKDNKEQIAQDLKSKGSDMFKTFSSSSGLSSRFGFGPKTS